MAEYIDMDALLLRIDCHGTNKFGMLDEDIRVFVKEQPTVDAEVVVRCKDCKYYDRGECYHPRHERHLQSICQEDDDFCSYGERKAEM